jgi:predicted transcriptional regulator
LTGAMDYENRRMDYSKRKFDYIKRSENISESGISRKALYVSARKRVVNKVDDLADKYGRTRSEVLRSLIEASEKMGMLDFTYEAKIVSALKRYENNYGSLMRKRKRGIPAHVHITD